MSKVTKTVSSTQNQSNIINTTMLNQNNPALMGKTIYSTLYQNQSQIPNQTINSTIPIKDINSFNKNNIPNSQITNNNQTQNVIAKTAVPITNNPNRLNPIETENNCQIPKSQVVIKDNKFKNMTINRDGKTISNIDLNDDIQSSRINPPGINNNISAFANSAKSVYQGSTVQSQNLQQQTNQNINSQQSINDKKIHSTIQLASTNQNVNNPNKQSIQPVHQSQKTAIPNQSTQQTNILSNTNANLIGQTICNTVYPNQNGNATLAKHSVNNTYQPNINPHSQLNNTTINPNANRGSKAPIQNTHVHSNLPNQNPLLQNNTTALSKQSVNNAHHSNVNTQLNNTTNTNKGSKAPIQNIQAHSNLINQNPAIQNNNVASHNQSELPSLSNHQSKEYIEQNNQMKGTPKESEINNINNSPNKLKKTSLMRKSSLKASRNKSPPRVTRTPDGKYQSAEIDNNGNSYFVETDKDPQTPDICSNLNKYLENEIKHSQLKEIKPENPKKGNGFRYFAQLTKAGRNQNGQKKTDQDTPLVHLNVGGIAGFNLFGVLDGHGPHGHFVSQFCRDHFIKYMTNYAEQCLKKKIKRPEEIYHELKNQNFEYIIDTFNKADNEMSKQNQFDYNFSGTTCNIVFQFNKHLVCASVGDSRGILVEDRGDNQNQGIFELSHDHKPDLPKELARIQSKGGSVDKIIDSFGERVGPPRVWKAGTNYPGLAMSRSLGDFQAKQCGVISLPEIIEYSLSSSTRYAIICSDGVWEFINNEQVRDLGNIYFKKNDVGGFCTNLVKFAVHI